MTLFRHLALAATLCAAPAIAAPQFEKLDLLEQRIAVALGAGIGQPGGPARPIDRRLKLAACPDTPEIATPTAASAVVRCGMAGWRIYVPLVPPPAPPTVLLMEGRPMVRKGEQVQLVANGGGFTVSTLAVADQDGVAGERIRVRTSAKAAPLTVEVAGQGQVVIGPLK